MRLGLLDAFGIFFLWGGKTGEKARVEGSCRLLADLMHVAEGNADEA